MSYIGSTPTSQNFTSGTDYFSGTGSQTAFTLTRTVNSVNDIEVVINNVVQQPSTAYTLSGTTITFTSAPSSGTNNIYVRYLATNMQSFTVPANSISRTQLDSNLQAGFQGRNKIINGHMVVDQRNAGASSTPSSNAYTLDRWQTNTAGGSYTVQQNAGSVTPPAGFKNYYGVTSTGTTAANTFAIRQAVEGYNIADLDWGSSTAKTVCLSFWVRSSLTGLFSGSFLNNNFDRAYVFTYNITTANTWQYVTIPIVGDSSGTWESTNSAGLWLWFAMGVSTAKTAPSNNAWLSGDYRGASGTTNVMGTSGATFYITGVQLEEGTTATSFERENYTVTDMKCKRYYLSYTVASTCTSWSVNSTQNLAIGFPVTMRATPTYKGILSGAWSGNTPAENYNCKDGYTWYHASYFYGNGSLVVGFDAEL